MCHNFWGQNRTNLTKLKISRASEMTSWKLCKLSLLAGLLWRLRICHLLVMAKIEPVVALAPTAQEFLEPHNAARAQVELPPLQWNATLAAYAKAHGRRQRDANECEMMVHSRNGSDGYDGYGENLFWGSHRDTTAEWAVKYWTSEREFYDYGANRCEPAFVECRHYTQIVWRGSSQLGCAAVQCRDASVLVVCEYFPPGNVVGMRPF